MNIFRDVIIYILSLLFSLSITLGTESTFLNSSWGKDISTDWKTPTIEYLDLTVEPEGGVPAGLEYLYEINTVDEGEGYLAHPDSVLLQNGDILQVYPKGHGKGEILTKFSSDIGKTYHDSDYITVPDSWANSQETPTIYRLDFTESDRDDMLVLISANPSWGKTFFKGGFDSSVSQDEGKTWTEFKTFNTTYNGITKIDAIVAMSSLTKLKENGEFVDKWMGTFHDSNFHNYSSILTIDENGNEHWSTPVRYLDDQRMQEMLSQVCEVEVIRSEQGQGDELCLITRSQSKVVNSLVTFSSDEGKTWSPLKALPSSLSGERFKAEYLEDGRLAITFRSILRDKELAKEYGLGTSWYSQGPLMWVGTYDDIKNGDEGQYLIKLAHTYFDGQTESQDNAHADTGYCGVTIVDGTEIVVSSYGRFSPDATYVQDGNEYLKTYIMSKTMNINDLDSLSDYLNAE